MNNPSPLQPAGRLSQPGARQPRFHLAVISIVLLHAVFFGGLLLQGCKPKATDTAGAGFAVTNAPLDLGQPYGDASTNFTAFPTNPPAQGFAATGAPATNLWSQPPAQSLWQQPAATAPAVPPDTYNQAMAAPAAELSEYRIVSGDTPARIARKHGITLEQLREANPNMDDRRLQVGTKLAIPAAASRAARDTVAAGTGAATDTGSAIYEVRPGDTLTKIARQHKTTVREIRSLNGLKTDRITVRQKLKVPAAAPAAVAPVPTPDNIMAPAFQPAAGAGAGGAGFGVPAGATQPSPAGGPATRPIP